MAMKDITQNSGLMVLPPGPMCSAQRQCLAGIEDRNMIFEDIRRTVVIFLCIRLRCQGYSRSVVFVHRALLPLGSSSLSSLTTDQSVVAS